MLTDNEIKKALGRMSCKTLNDCKLINNALDLINRLQAENEGLNIVHKYIDKVIIGNQNFAIADEYLFAYEKALEQLYSNVNTKAEAYKEFAEKLHEELRMYGTKDKFNKVVFLSVVDKAKKEMVGEDK